MAQNGHSAAPVIATVNVWCACVTQSSDDTGATVTHLLVLTLLDIEFGVVEIPRFFIEDTARKHHRGKRGDQNLLHAKSSRYPTRYRTITCREVLEVSGRTNMFTRGACSFEKRKTNF